MRQRQHLKIYAIILLSYLPLFLSAAIPPDSLHFKKISGTTLKVGDVYIPKPEKWEHLPDIPEHIGFRTHLTADVKDSLLSEINDISRNTVKDTLMTPDLFRIFRPYFDWLRYIDPHYMVFNYNVMSSLDYPTGRARRKVYKENVRSLPFDLLNINDTLVIRISLDTLFHKGDMVLSINGNAVSDILVYSYSDRHTTPGSLLRNYYSQDMTDRYEVAVMRNGRNITLRTSGRKNEYDTSVRLRQLQSTENNVRRYGDNTGYILIPEFFQDNSRLIRIIRKALLAFKKDGIGNVILDLRNNPGGYGDRFDELLSMFIDKDSILYMNIQKIMQDGIISEIPENEFFRSIELDNSLFISGLKYYVLMNSSTVSVAASFCNIMQYNSAATIVGEPLPHNALRYGETVSLPSGRFPHRDLPALFRETGISIVEFDEYTETADGILMPDIGIPYIAEDYLTGKDGMLEKLLEIIISSASPGIE